MTLSGKQVAGLAISVAGLSAVVFAFLLPHSPLKGWCMLLGFGAVGLTSVSGLLPSARRNLSTAIGTYFVFAGGTFGARDLWPGSPQWFRTALLLGQTLAVAWAFFELWRTRRRFARSA